MERQPECNVLVDVSRRLTLLVWTIRAWGLPTLRAWIWRCATVFPRIRQQPLGVSPDDLHLPRALTAAPPLGMPLDDHVHLDDMDVRQFVMAPAAQALICAMQRLLLELPYDAFGRTTGSSGKFNLVLPSTFGSDRRKPVTPEFQSFCEAVFWPIMNSLLFGVAWAELRPHLTSFKVNTLKISEDEFYYDRPIYHFHLDHRIGRFAPNDHGQKRTKRMIFSIVPASLRPAAGGGVEAARDPAFDSTVYLCWQPPHGFHSNEELHHYLGRRYPERGLSSARERPLYEVTDRACRDNLTLHP